MTRGLRVDTDGTVTELNWEDSPDGGLRQLQNAVGGTIDVVDLSGDLSMWVNDEGIYTYPVNPAATHIAHHLLGPVQNFHGPAVFTGGVSDEGTTLPLAEAKTILITTVSAQFR